jgi:Ca2+-binding EF-hand superfamily protein
MSVHANPYLLVLPQLMSAKKKIGTVAAFFDPTKISLAGFDSVCLDATQFREQLRRNLCINVSDEELGALVYLFDKNGDGFIDSIEFKNEFFRLGKQERAKFNFRKEEEKQKRAERMARTEAKQEEYLARFAKTNVSDTWTEVQQKNAIKKIAHIAFTYDGFKGGLEAFDNAKSIKPEVFKEILRRKFETNLTPEETGALVDIFDRDQNGMVDTREFVYQFFRIGREEKEYYSRKQKQKTIENANIEKERKLEAAERFGKLVVAKMSPHTQEDYNNALNKITKAALHFKSDSVFSSNLWKSFESSDLNPTEFKELLKSNFDIILTSGELDAMVHLFDTDKNGDVSCVEFMTTFFRIALKERSVVLTKKREKERKTLIEKKERLESRIFRQKMLTLTSVVWPVLPNNSDNESIINIPNKPVSIVELASLVGTGPGEIGTYLMDHHQMIVDSKDMIQPHIAKNVAEHHGYECKIITDDNDDTNNGDTKLMEENTKVIRSIAPPLPTGKKGSRNSFLQKKPSLQSAISPSKGLSKGIKNGKMIKSLADLFPSASKDAKDFIKDLELKEKNIKYKNKKKKGGGGGSSNNNNGTKKTKFGAIRDAPSSNPISGNKKVLGKSSNNNNNNNEDSNLDEWQFADGDNQIPLQNNSLYNSADFESRPGTSANSDRASTSKSGSRGGGGGRGSPVASGSSINRDNGGYGSLDGTSMNEGSIEEGLEVSYGN